MQKKSVTMRDIFKVYWSEMRKHPFILVGLTMALVLSSVMDVVIPLYLKRFFDVITKSAPSSTMEMVLFGVVVAVVGMRTVGAIGRRSRDFMMAYFVPRVMEDLRMQIFGYLVYHSHNFFSNMFAGALVERVRRIGSSFNNFFGNVYNNIGSLIFRIVGFIIVIWHFSQSIAVAMLIWAVTFIIFNYVYSLWKLPVDRERAAKSSIATGITADILGNHSSVQMFASEAYEYDRLKAANNEQRRLATKTWNMRALADLIQSVLFIGIEFLIFYLAIKYWRNGLVTAGFFVLIQSYMISLIDSLWDFGRVIRDIYESNAEAEEAIQLLQVPYDIKDAKNALELKVKRGKIDFQKVSFHFHKTRQVLDAMTLAIRPGERVALVGHSGAGKSTLIKLLFRLYDPDDGKILIDGQDIRKVTQASLRNAIGMVPQDPILFHRTLMDNIRYGRRSASDEEVMEAAKKAHCHEFIAALPEGYQTFVGERGIKLSGGERQRVAIARAFLKNAPILVLDEATSSLDSEVELLIQESLRELMCDKTVLVIAHRLSTIRQMDRIIVLEGGKVIDQGTHEDLLENQGLYASLWRLQSGGFITMKETE